MSSKFEHTDADGPLVITKRSKAKHAAMSRVKGDTNLSHDIDLDWAAWNASHKGKKSLKKMKKGQSDAFAAVARAQAKANATRGGGSVKAKAKPSAPKLTAKTAIKQAQAKKKFKGTPGMQAIAKLAAKNGINLSNDISLGKDGSKWKHGYVPENPAAVALKAHKTPGGKSSGGSNVLSGDAAKARNAALAEKGIRDTIKSDHPMGASRDYQGRDVMVVGHAGRKVKVSDSHNRTTKLVLPHTLSATSKTTSIHISDPAKIKNAATMFGTGSKQHKAAIARFGAKKSGK